MSAALVACTTEVRGTGGGVIVGPNATALGKACATSTDCGGAGVTCVPVSSTAFDGSGPAGGLCAVDCLADPLVCAKYDPTSSCVQVSSQAAYCLEGCEIGPSSISYPKCHGRGDLACTELVGNTGADTGTSVCYPTCRADSDCAGRKCDLSSGFCSDATALPAGTAPIGASCNPNAATNDCAGICVALGGFEAGASSAGICSGLCTLGQIGCGNAPTAKGPFDSTCFFQSEAEADLGDQGVCGQLCDCTSQCRAPGLVCVALPADIARLGGHPGICSLPSDASGNPVTTVSCGPGGADASAR